MKTSVSSSSVSVSGSVGGQKGSVGIKDNGTVNLGLDFGGVKLGITNDYGGAGTVGFGGQSITWGLEGGNIKLGIGGLEVLVEARDCVVVEIKKIAGMIVSQRSYPDPGCKLPTPTPVPTPATPVPDSKGIPPDSIQGDNRLCYALVDNVIAARTVGGFNNGVSNTQIIGNIPDPVPTPRLPLLPFRVEVTNITSGTIFNWNYPGDTLTGSYSEKATAGTTTFWSGVTLDNIQGVRINQTISFERTGSSIPVPQLYPMVYLGLAKDIGAFVSYVNLLPVNAPNRAGRQLKITRIIYVGKRPDVVPSPSAGNRPPMPESCCESLKADIEDIKEVLATKEMLAKKLTFPWRLRMPGGEGDEVITDYANLARCIAQMIDHLGIHPPKLSIKDINNAVAGDQSISNQFPSATQGFEALMAQVWDANADVDTLTNFLYRLSWLSVQQSMNLARLSGDIQCIKDMCGGETEPAESSITTPFNIGAGIEEKAKSTKGKGFGKGFGEKSGGSIDKSIEANTELSTEKLLPDFLRIRENPVVVQTFSGNKDIFDLLSIIILKLEGLQNR
ncbi:MULTISPECIES: hypothetical protein [unclassified Microcoleus]|uniref:hypothetical protein n=1 Tax=unclassified Microcoleus TaxID=2642155 RepID=UPI001D4970DA|nr:MULTISPECIES: hypothetical protein [unclassified Microcoleus]MCC3473987.1 hypothetical protein [Microcoleus sp. PH2017_13_LAR_U_A]MCC3486069.1 hypothetical protein [Microcoleus sp. PH2017_14_LAR_D_A]MCC3598601.1 hypothetical protein [Microcoleus sp. PH2017_26_ELK_O_A]MCC3623917.1 hypothetical protein [Microcoleus sp. PH2017_36_ELK_O_B]